MRRRSRPAPGTRAPSRNPRRRRPRRRPARVGRGRDACEMADRPNVATRVWSRATLLARLTIAGLAAAVLLSALFGYLIAKVQERSAREQDEQRVGDSTRLALISIDR